MFGSRLVTYEPNTGCWLYIGGVCKDGYAKVKRSGQFLGHRASYVESVGPIPDGCEIDHLCRVRCCVNPAHLEPVTHGANVRRGVYPKETHRNGRKTHCKRGHALEGSNLIMEGSNLIMEGPARKCRACKMASMRERYARKRGKRA